MPSCLAFHALECNVPDFPLIRAEIGEVSEGGLLLHFSHAFGLLLIGELWH